MSKAKESAASGSKRRVTVRRKGAAPEVDPAIAYAIAQAVETQDIEGVRQIVLQHEAQMHTLRVILFDLLIIFREEHYKAQDVVSKKRFAEHIGKVRATLEQNVPEFKAYHKDANDIDDLDAAEPEDNIDFSMDLDEAIREIAAEADEREAENEVGDFPGPIDDDLLDEMLERVSEETEERTTEPRRLHPRTQSRPPRRRR